MALKSLGQGWLLRLGQSGGHVRLQYCYFLFCIERIWILSPFLGQGVWLEPRGHFGRPDTFAGPDRPCGADGGNIPDEAGRQEGNGHWQYPDRSGSVDDGFSDAYLGAVSLGRNSHGIRHEHRRDAGHDDRNEQLVHHEEVRGHGDFHGSHGTEHSLGAVPDVGDR